MKTLLWKNSFKYFDLTQTMSKGMPDWDGNCGFQMKVDIDYPKGLRVQSMTTPNGIGTHMDAPSHFIKDEKDIASIDIDQLICPGFVIDVEKKAHADYAISKTDIRNFESEFGQIPPNSIAIGKTGWGKYWYDPEKYRNADKSGKMHFPRFSKDATEYLLSKDIAGIATDTLSPDGGDETFPVHHRLLSKGKIIIENLKITDDLPLSNIQVIALPLKIKHATEAPCRVIALSEV